MHQVRQSLLLGCLQEGGRLPTVKDVAASLVINPNTIVKALPAARARGPGRRSAGAGSAGKGGGCGETFRSVAGNRWFWPGSE